MFGFGEEEKKENIHIPNVPELPKRDLLSMEKETTGLYLSGHPLDDYRDLIARADCATVRAIAEDLSSDRQRVEPPKYRDGMHVVLAAVITAVRMKTTKNNSMMAYVTAEDLTGSVELIAFSSVLQQAGDWLREDKAVWIAGRIDAREDEAPKILPSAVYPLEEQYLERAQEAVQERGFSRRRETPRRQPQPNAAQSGCRHKLYLRIDSLDDPRLGDVKALLGQYRGDLPVYLFCADTRKTLRAAPSMWVYNNLLFLDKLRFILGEENVIMK